MKKKSRKIYKKNNGSTSEFIFPVEQWLIPSLQFSHVRGLARVFLISEICLSVLVVSGTLILILFKFL